MKEIDLEKRKTLQLDILKEVDSFCRAHNLTYYLAFGSLIGAIRHKGYIPWDDDVDIMMPRKDFEEMSKIFPTDGNYCFLTPDNTKNFPYAFGKVIDVRTIKKEPIRAKYQVIGLDIDVFPIDNYPDDLEEGVEWCDRIAKTQSYMHNLIVEHTKGRNYHRSIAKNVLISIRRFLDDCRIISVYKYVDKLVALSKKYNNSNTNYCGIAAIATYGVRKRNRKEVFESAVEVEFEGEMFFAPKGYDEYLKDIYGDYMQLPPIEKRVTHHTNRAYWK